MPCAIFAFEKRGDIYCPSPGYPFTIQKSSQSYSRNESRSTARWLGPYNLPNATSTQSKLQGKRAHYPTRCSTAYRLSRSQPRSSSTCRCTLQRYPDLWPTATRDTTSGQGAPACSSIRRLRLVLSFTCACWLRGQESR